MAAKRARTLTDWDPEDRNAWDNGGSAIARRNLVWSVMAGHIGFSVWSLWFGWRLLHDGHARPTHPRRRQ